MKKTITTLCAITLILLTAHFCLASNGWYESLQDHGNVDQTAPGDKQILIWDDTLQLWIPDYVDISDVDNAIDGSGTANYVSKFSDANTLTDSVMYDDGTNIGIGTMSPGAKLEVSGDINVDGSSAYKYAGYNGLKLATKGDSITYTSTIIGRDAGDSVTDGSTKRQTALGYYAGRFNSGSYQTALGYTAGYFNSGSYQTALGYYAGRSNSGSYQTALGYAAGRFNSGSSQTALGSYAGHSNSGSYQTALGYYAGSEQDGNYNTAIGYNAFNTFVEDAGSAVNFGNTDIDAGNDRVTVTGHGLGATGTYLHLKFTQGTSEVPGLNNNDVDQWYIVDANTLEVKDDSITDAGSGTGHTLTPRTVYSNSLALGYDAEPDASNQIVLGNASVTQLKTAANLYITGSNDNYINGNVGIGTTSPSEKLEVAGDVEITDDTPHLEFIDTTSGHDDYEFYADANQFYLQNLDSEAELMRFDSNDDVHFSGTITAAGLTPGGNLTMADDEWIGLGSSAGRIVFDNKSTDEVNIMNARVGIGTATPSGQLDVSGGDRLTGLVVRGTTNAAIRFINTGTNGRDWQLFGTNGSDSGDGGLSIYDDTGDRYTMSIMPSGGIAIGDTYAHPTYGTDVSVDDVIIEGNVGIGTTTPATTLHVYGSTPNLRIEGSIGNVYPGLYIDHADQSWRWYIDGANDKLVLKDETDSKYPIFIEPATTARLHLDGGDFKLISGGDEVIRIHNSGAVSIGDGYVATDPGGDNVIIEGNVGIGTTSPLGKLHLNGGMFIQDVVTVTDGDVTPDVSGGNIFITSSNTAATEITDLDNPQIGQIVTIICGNTTNASTITDGGNFALAGNWTPDTVGDNITLFVNADNDYWEKGRSNN